MTVFLWPQQSEAALKCEEKERTCVNAASIPVSVNGESHHIAAPILDGYDTACWHWKKRFQCIETDPIYQCDSGRPVDEVKSTCNLVDATILATEKINTIQYITSAEYTYRCNWGEWETEELLPTGKECVLLESVITDTKDIPGAELGTHPKPNPDLNEAVVVDQDKDDEYVCYSPPVQTCADTCYADVPDPVTGIAERTEVPCESPVTNCVVANDQCVGTVEGGFEVGPDGRCIQSDQSYVCQSGPIPRCLADEQCVLDSTNAANIMENGVAMTEEQNYICSNTTVSCAETSEVSNCVHVSAWGWDQLHHPSTIGTGLGEFNQAMARVEAIEKGMNDNDPYIFSGINLRCHYAVGNFLNTAIMVAIAIIVAVATAGTGLPTLAGLLQSTFTLTAAQAGAIAVGVSAALGAAGDAPNSKAMGANCCKEQVIEGKEAWYKFGKCTADEVKLAIAKQKGLSYYLGTYCSKRKGFPVKQCVEKTKSYCVFDDMLGLVINKQGRAQLEEIAAADPLTSIATPEMEFQLFAETVEHVEPTQQEPHAYSGRMNNGSWQKLANDAGSQVWYWQYPGYCLDPASQQAAYDLYDREVNMTHDTTGKRDGELSQEEALGMLVSISGIQPFQSCADTEGEVYFMTCGDENNACDESRLPEDPDNVSTDEHGENVNEADPRWRTQRVQANYLPGQYGVTARMQSNQAFAAVSNSLSELVSSVGSCQGGDCLFKFVLTERGDPNSLGARKRIKDYIKFPLYTIQQSITYPSIDYVSPTGGMAPGAWEADPNRTLGTSVDMNNHRFIFRPNFLATAPKGNIHSHVLLEWSPGGADDSWKAILVPTSLPPGTDGFWPYGDPNDSKKQFYISGGCDANSRWCNYQVESDLIVPRHPWGSAKNPRCWGFSIEQMAALDFDRMDLSEWLNSLDLGSASAGLSESAAQAFTDRVMESSQSFYESFKEGDAVESQLPGRKALITNTDFLPVLSQENYQAYTLKVAVTSNWPILYYNEAENLNPVSNVIVDFGTGKPDAVVQAAPHPDGRGFIAWYDYEYTAKGNYKITVTLDTLNNGPQVLTTNVEITPNAGQRRESRELDFENWGSVGDHAGEYIPSEALDGTIGGEQGADALSPGTKEQYEAQGGHLAGPKAKN